MPIVLVRCAECGRSFRPFFDPEFCTLACRQQHHEHKRRMVPPPPPPSECRSLYHRDAGIEEPAWVRKALEPPALPWEPTAG